MELGSFSISLAVKDLAVSQAFYEKIGFSTIAGEPDQKWAILKNGKHVIGLFQGMFESNILTFNPGWDQDCNTLESFDDVRKLHQSFKEQGIETIQPSLEGDSGPGSFSMVDPDGNTILVDQQM